MIVIDFGPTKGSNDVSVKMRQDGILIGSAKIQDLEFIHSVYVISKERRKGHGEKLILAIIDYIKDCDVDAVGLDVRRDNPPAIALYEKIGFKMVKVQDDPTHFRMFIKTGYVCPVEDEICQM